MISTAADRAAAALAAQIPANITAYVDLSEFSAEDQAYGIATINDALLRHGVRLVSDRSKAEAVIVPRAGVLSTDEKQVLFGLPALPFPTPVGAAPISTPSISFYRNDTVNGIAKFAASVYDPNTGRLILSTDPAYGFSHASQGVALFLFSWRTDDSDIDLANRQPRAGK